MRSLFIDEIYLKENTPIAANLDVSEVYPFVITVQEIYIQEAIGTNLLRYLEGVLSASPQVISDDDETVINYIRNALAWYSIYEAIPFVWMKIRNIGMVKQSGDNMEAASEAEMNTLRKLCETKGVWYINRLIAYLCKNGSLYASYNTECWSCGEVSPTGKKKNSVDLYFDNDIKNHKL